jgi:hypothetical protein
MWFRVFVPSDLSLLTPRFSFVSLAWPIANYQLPFAVLQPGWQGCRLKQHQLLRGLNAEC